MIVREVTTAATIEDGVQAHPQDADHAAEAEARIGTGVGVAALGVGTAIEDGRPQGVHPRPLGTAVGSIRVHLRLATPGNPGHNPLPPEGILEATAPCHRLPGAVHPLPPVVIAAARSAVTVGRVHHQDHPRGPTLPQDNAVVRLLPVLRCQLVLGEVEVGVERSMIEHSLLLLFITVNILDRKSVV